MISALAWALAALWGLILLRAARPGPPPLPEPAAEPPDYALIWPSAAPPPPLDPPPRQIIQLARLIDPPEALNAAQIEPEWALILDPHLSVPADLPARLARAEGGFASTLPIPSGGPLAQSRERALRDFAQPERVADIKRPEGYADPRCAWARVAEIHEIGADPLRLARARKLRCAPVTLYDGRDAAQAPLVRAAPWSSEAWSAVKGRALGEDPLVRLAARLIPALICYTPLLILPLRPRLGLLILGLGATARLMTALRDGFGLSLSLLGAVLDPLPWLAAAPRPSLQPAPPRGEAMRSTRPAPTQGGAWLERAATADLARHLGGGAPVMEHIYAGVAVGRGAWGRFLDGQLLITPAARAVRHRLYLTRALARAAAAAHGPNARVLSIPCGGARDLIGVDAQLTLADPDPEARRRAAALHPSAEILDATIEAAPDGPFDLILFIGLSEYFDDEALLRQLSALRARLSPNGVLLCSATADHPQREAMQRWFGWRTRARDPQAFQALLAQAGLRRLQALSDPFEVQWVFEACSDQAPIAPR
ncbi:class I SAM-dependent methyltransferase [Myxococcota bacterium]|nr:class I SAM-dependent methyltransferase [Myxococcota bacterium]